VQSVESRSSWIVASVVLLVLTLAFGAPWIVVVALKTIAAENGGLRTVPALASSLAWIGLASGGVVMGWVAERAGTRLTVIFGSIMICAGLALSCGPQTWQLYLGQGLLVGFLGIGSMNAPFYVYVSRWFDRHRGSALALISSGAYMAGAIWPPAFERLVFYAGWRQTMLWFAICQLLIIAPLATIFLRAAPDLSFASGELPRGSTAAKRVLGWPRNFVFALMAIGAVFCCMPMAMPQAHLPALCSDLGYRASHGAAMVSVLLGSAFVSRQFWGIIADRFGGLRTALIGSSLQILTMIAFVVTQDEIGLFTVSAAAGFGFAGIIPANILAIRELFPVSEAYWRIPTFLLLSGSGMAAGAWLAGTLYDHFGFYAPAFVAAVLANAINLLILSVLVLRQERISPRYAFS
jgi:MFS family permease